MAGRRPWPDLDAEIRSGDSRIGIGTRRLPGIDRVAIVLMALGTILDTRLVRLIAPARLNWRISTSPRRYDSTDSAPLFSLGRSGWSPSEQLPVSGSISAVWRSFS